MERTDCHWVDTTTEPTDSITINSDTLSSLDPEIMMEWTEYYKFAQSHGLHYPDYLSIYLWERFKKDG